MRESEIQGQTQVHVNSTSGSQPGLHKSPSEKTGRGREEKKKEIKPQEDSMSNPLVSQSQVVRGWSPSPGEQSREKSRVSRGT